MPIQQEELLFRPQYSYLTVRDYTLVDQPGFNQALTVAQTQVAASNGSEIVIVCAQDTLRIRTVVYVHEDQPACSESDEWPGRISFTLPVPTSQLHVGDAFGNAVIIDLPGPPGDFAVDISYRGREQARAKVAETIEQFAAMPLRQGMEWLEQWSGIEEYRIDVRHI
ncbi:hypothetical protein [Micromonospora sp. NPDC007230]|uniref:hypothetical protein n=1 Tax=Micromonospora sp. NPDC007230 TaxID=3364237 RepID=UPI0036AAFA4E